MGRHAVLGATGQMGRLLVPELQRRGHTVLALSRDWQYAPHGGEVEHRAVDMLDSDSLTAATDGADVLYAVVGLPYAAQVWQRDWPPAMRNLISAVEANGCKLVFLDNVYAYGLVAGAMTEATAYNPCSRKGEVRARIATELMEADKTGRSRHIAEGQHSGRLEIIDELFADDYVRHDLRPTQASPGPAGMKRISPRTSAPVDPASGSRRRPNHG